MRRYIVSSHGGNIDNTRVIVPQDYTIYFFVNEGQILSDEDGWQIWNRFAGYHSLPFNKQFIRSKIKYTVIGNGTNTVINYGFWYNHNISTQGFNRSGVFRRRDLSAPIIDLHGTSEAAPRRLSDLFTDPLIQAPCEIYWLACRS